MIKQQGEVSLSLALVAGTDRCVLDAKSPLQISPALR